MFDFLKFGLYLQSKGADMKGFFHIHHHHDTASEVVAVEMVM